MNLVFQLLYLVRILLSNDPEIRRWMIDVPLELTCSQILDINLRRLVWNNSFTLRVDGGTLQILGRRAGSKDAMVDSRGFWGES